MNTLLFTAKLDNRYGEKDITSRIGIRSAAQCFDHDMDLFTAISDSIKREPAHCVLLDEAQFLSKDHVFQLGAVADNLNIPVLCYGLRTDFQANLFEGSKWLLAIADELQELKTICDCGRKATMNLRINADGQAVTEGEAIEIGGNERYVPLCRRHFMEKTIDL